MRKVRSVGILLGTVALAASWLGMGNLSADLRSDIQKAEKIAALRNFGKERGALLEAVGVQREEIVKKLRQLGYTIPILQVQCFTGAKNSQDLHKEFTTMGMQYEELYSAFYAFAHNPGTHGYTGRINRGIERIRVNECPGASGAYYDRQSKTLVVLYNLHCWATRALRATWNWLCRVDRPGWGTPRSRPIDDQDKNWIDQTISTSGSITRAMYQVP